ncbi:phytanoyl-CoA dioxygenase family protein [Acidocella sp.]|uniref:phytanoyl-CoA dioxygenase family protein n=1 Tax=Acidocella sp. TaxID=50710 RepID=UPI002610E086|nr:phytanoyl-CoA dioxygenase family protein [Acidocella sp.]
MPNELKNPDAEAVVLWARQLLRDGFCIIRDAFPPPSINTLSDDLDECFAGVPFCEGDFYGRRTKRFGALLNRSSVGADLVRHPLILAIASEVLGPWCDRFNLNLTQGIEIHPGAPAQFPHRDEDMWGGPKGEMQYLLNVIWPLNDFTTDNGATRIWPNSRSDDVIDARGPGIPVVAEMEPGAALLILGSTLHAAGSNKTAAARRGLIISYCLGWLKPFENQWLCYPPHIARQFDPDLAHLVGYSLHKPNLGNYEGQCPSILLGDYPPAYLAATDALRADQEEALAGFMAAMAELEAGSDSGDPGD